MELMKPRSEGESVNSVTSIGAIVALALPRNTDRKYPTPNGIKSRRKSGVSKMFLSFKMPLLYVYVVYVVD